MSTPDPSVRREKNHLGASPRRSQEAGSSERAAAPHDATVNLNDFVWVRLKDHGRAMLRESDARWSTHYSSSYGRLATAEKQELENAGWSRWQLWSLIQEFGHALYLGCDPPFETTIRLVEPRIGSGTQAAMEPADATHRSAAPKSSSPSTHLPTEGT